MFKRKIAFVITAQHCIPHGGIGQFCKSFVDMAKELEWAVHIILDKAPAKSSLVDYLQEQDNVKLFYSQGTQQYTNHNKTFVFEDTMNFERMLNVRANMLDALERNIYDMVLINSPDAVSTIYNLGLQRFVPVVFYTHSENFIFLEKGANKVFSEACVYYMQNLLQLPGLTIGTQTSLNTKHIQENFNLKSVALPMRVPELQLLFNVDVEKEGVLFTGRWEPRKNPKVFCDAVIEMDVPAKVLTNAKGKEKFEAYFKEHNFTKYEIRASIIGQEKVDFIRSAKIAFHPAQLESFGFSAFESLHSCPTFCLEKYDWWNNFAGLVVPLGNDYVEELKSAYNTDDLMYEGRLRTLYSIDQYTIKSWKEFVETDSYAGQSNVENALTKAVDESEQSFGLLHYYLNILKRQSIAIDDVHTVYKKQSQITLTQLLEDTYITKQGSEFNPMVEETTSLEDLF